MRQDPNAVDNATRLPVFPIAESKSAVIRKTPDFGPSPGLLQLPLELQPFEEVERIEVCQKCKLRC